MPTPLPHQIEGSTFLASRKAALLADAPRVGKTGASILGADDIYAQHVLVITKSSARADWGRQFKDWQDLRRTVQVIYKSSEKLNGSDVTVVGWGMVFNKKILEQLTAKRFDLVILDESHEAKNPDAQRTKAVYKTIVRNASYVWCLSGTPVPNAPCDLWPMLSHLAPERIARYPSFDAFKDRFCVVRPKYINGRWVEIVKGGKNEDELRTILDGFMLRRTQQDVGISPPLYSLLTLHADDLPNDLKADGARIVEAINNEETLDDMHMAEVRRLTGVLKARAVAEIVKEELDEGLDRVVLMCWHKEVMQILKDELSLYGVVGIDGSTPATARQAQVDAFRDGTARVFIGQILAAGEAIDLSAACNLIFVEMSFTPKDGQQAALRICNHSQKRQALVRVCALEGSIDEAVSSILIQKIKSISKIMERQIGN